jgi:hypothetical protein
MVTSHKMNENEMGYRGSKSEFLNLQPNKFSVKEQRVDGSYFTNHKLMKLRCTLTGFERNYQTKISSKQFVIQNKNFSTNSQYKNLPFSNICDTSSILPVSALKGWTDANLIRLNPWFVTGFTDADGCFGLYIYKNKNYKTGWSINLVFQISLHEKDINLLEQIKFYFGVGGISKHGSASLKYSVRSHKDMQIIIDHFDKFPLITNKLKDYKLFKLAYILFLKKEQLSIEGIKKLVSIKSEMNLGLSLELKASFPDIVRLFQEKDSNTCHSLSLVERNYYNIPDPN